MSDQLRTNTNVVFIDAMISDYQNHIEGFFDHLLWISSSKRRCWAIIASSAGYGI